jgi:hypothetical protein
VIGAFAGIAFQLAGIGMHGLLAYNVSQRARKSGSGGSAADSENRNLLELLQQRIGAIVPTIIAA